MSKAGKLLVAGALALLVLMVLLWHQLDTSTASPVSPGHVVVPVASAPASASMPQVAKLAPPVPAPEPTEEPTPANKKIAVESDAFFYNFQELVPKKLTAEAAQCYEGIAASIATRSCR